MIQLTGANHFNSFGTNTTQCMPDQISYVVIIFDNQ
jgi:hypothetical protein